MEQQVENGASPKAKARSSRKRISQGTVLAIGDRVTVLQFQEDGVIRFIGSTKFSEGEWVGVELDTPTGKNSGAVRGTHYFKCRENHGVFARKAGMQQVAGLSQDAAAKPAAASDKNGTTERPKNGLRTKPAGSRVSARSVVSDRQAAEEQLQGAIKNRRIGEIRMSLQVAVNAGASQDVIQSAREMIHFQSQQEVLQQLTSVRSALLKLSETVKSAEERATRLEQAAMANREIVASESAHASIKNWMFQCVDRIEQRVWLSVEARVEEKVRSAIDRAMAPQANGAQAETDGSSSASQAPKASIGLASADVQALPSEDVQARAQFWNDALQHKARHDIKAALQSGNLKQSLRLQSLRRQSQADTTSEVQEVSVKAYEVMTKAVSSGELGAVMDKQVKSVQSAQSVQILATGVWREPENRGKFDELSQYIQDKQAGELRIFSQQDEATLEAGCVFNMLTKHYPEKVAGKAVIAVGTGRGSCQMALFQKGSKGKIAKTVFSKGYAKDAVDPGKAEDKAAAFNDLWSAISDRSVDGVVIATWGSSGAFVDWPSGPNQINENIVSAVTANGKGGLEWINSEAQGVNMLVLSSMKLPDGTKWMISWCSEDRQDYIDLGSGKAASVKGPGGEQVRKIQFDFQTESIAEIGDKIISMNKDEAAQRSPSAASDSVAVLRGLAAAANAVAETKPKVAAGLAVAAASVAMAMPREDGGRTLPNPSVAVGLATAANRAASQASPDTAKLISFAVTAALAAGGASIQKEETAVHSIAGACRTVCEGLLQASQAGLLQKLVLETVQQAPPQLSKLEIIDHLRRRAVVDLSAANKKGRLKERLIAEAHLSDQSEKLGWFGV